MVWARRHAVLLFSMLLCFLQGRCSINLSCSQWANQGDALSSLICNFALKYAIRKVQENEEELQLNGLNQVHIYADDINFFHEHINFIKNKTEFF
jgi:hypothetical protein